VQSSGLSPSRCQSQICDSNGCEHCTSFGVPATNSIPNTQIKINRHKTEYASMQVLMSRPREEWVHNIESRYKALENFTEEDARLQFLRILRSLPYGTQA
jgi:hypothetical protein